MPGRGAYWRAGGLPDGSVTVADMESSVQDILSPSLIYAEITANQTGFEANDDVIWDNEVLKVGTDISLNTGTGEFTLAAGTYELIAQLRTSGYSTGTAGAIIFAWTDDSNVVQNQSRATSYPVGNTNVDNASQDIAYTIIQTSSQLTVKVRCTGSGGTADVNNSGTRAIVRKLI